MCSYTERQISELIRIKIWTYRLHCVLSNVNVRLIIITLLCSIIVIIENIYYIAAEFSVGIWRRLKACEAENLRFSWFFSL